MIANPEFSSKPVAIRLLSTALFVLMLLVGTLFMFLQAGPAGAAMPSRQTLLGEASGTPIAGKPGYAVKGAPPVPPCGPAWRTVSSPDPGTVDEIYGIAAISPDDAWAVGESINGARHFALTEHWNGSAWLYESAPSPGTGENVLKSVTAISSNDIWAVGSYFDGSIYHMLVEHWSGTSWSQSPMFNLGEGNNMLTGIAAAGSNNIWAVGMYNSSNGAPWRTLTEHWDGSGWTFSISPNPSSYDNVLNGVYVTPEGLAWAVGYTGDPSTPAGRSALIIHWNGTNWVTSAPPTPISDNIVLNSITGSDFNRIFAVGEYTAGGVASTYALHYDGSSWTVEGSLNPGSNLNVFTGASIDMPNGDGLLAVGYQSDGTGPAHTLVERLSGAIWEVQPSEDPGVALDELESVAVDSLMDVWAGGFRRQGANDPDQTLIERYNEPCATPTPPPTAGPSLTPTFSPTPPTACTVEFTDVPVGSTFYPFVRCLACLGVIGGYPDGTFRPNAYVTRGQIAKIVSNAAGFSEDPGGQTFQDVAPGSTYYDWINRLANRHYMTGYSCGGPGEPCVAPANLPYFRPSDNASRGQLAKIVSNAQEYGEPHTEQTFQDVPVGSTFYLGIQRLASRYIVAGYPCGSDPAEVCVPPDNLPYFRPNRDVTRGQAAKIVSNSFFPHCNPPSER